MTGKVRSIVDRSASSPSPRLCVLRRAWRLSAASGGFECRREFVVVDKVVSMVADLFPWDEVESFAAELQQNGFRLLPAQAPGNRPSYDFEKMRKAAQKRLGRQWQSDAADRLEVRGIAGFALAPTQSLLVSNHEQGDAFGKRSCARQQRAEYASLRLLLLDRFDATLDCGNRTRLLARGHSAFGELLCARRLQVGSDQFR